MPKVKLEPVPDHIVVPDTNILWDKDKKNAVCPDFDQFWSRSSSVIPLKLFVPEVVLGELQFQQATSAIKCATTVSDQMTELSGITQKKYEPRLDHTTIRKQVGEKLKKWVASHGGQIITVPIASINWNQVIEDAIWRNPPFTFDPKDKDNEKGFRDALILETVCGICDSNKGASANIVFLCNDRLLRKSAETRQKHNKALLTFESISDFESYIKLTQQSLTDKFVKSIQTHARSKFYAPDDKTAIYFRENIRRTINEKFAADLTTAIEPPRPTGLLGLSPPTNWSVTDERWWINATRFDELVRPREYHWLSRVTIARLLLGAPVGGGLSLAFSPIREEVKVIGFDVKWKANVKADGRFHDISVIDIIKAETRQEPASDELLNQWRLQRNDMPPSIDNPTA